MAFARLAADYPVGMFGLTFEKLLIIGVIAVFLLGPERLPHYAAQLGRLVRSLRDMANGAKDRMREEMGPDFDEVDWKKLDPRQYDPRRIIREALTDVDPFAEPARAGRRARRRQRELGLPAAQAQARGARRRRAGAVRLRSHLSAAAPDAALRRARARLLQQRAQRRRRSLERTREQHHRLDLVESSARCAAAA